MSESSENAPTEAAATQGGGPSGRRTPIKGRSNTPQMLMIVALVIAVIAVVAAGWLVWTRSSSSGHSSSYSDEEIDNAKSSLCTATLKTRRAVVRNTHLKSPNPDDPIAGLAIAANARLALSGGGAYLHDQLAVSEAAPKELTDGVGNLAITLEELGISYLAGEPNDARDTLRQDLDDQMKEIGKLCE